MNFAYLGSLAAQISVNAIRELVQVLPAVCLLLFGFFSADSISVKHISLAQFLWASFVFLFTVILVATALYVDWGQLMVVRVVTFCHFLFRAYRLFLTKVAWSLGTASDSY